jgi:catechol 2,3-dioxygenase
MNPDAPALMHMGIFTDNPQAMQEFYVRVLGMVVSDSGSGTLFRRRIIFMTGNPHQHHQFVLVVREDGDPPGGALFQVSFKVRTLDELRRTAALATANGATELQGINHGNSWSVYFRDPDKNMVEIYMDTGWYVPQPFGDRFSLELDEKQMRAITAERIQSVAGSMSQAEWSDRIRTRLEEHRRGRDNSPRNPR